MTTRVTAKGQMVIPAKVRKEAGISQGDVLDVQLQGNGRLLVIRLNKPQEPARPKVKIIYRKGTHAVGSTGGKITSEQIRAALQDFP
jgi:AbrB family looped-hinge helix DNA binding protein